MSLRLSACPAGVVLLAALAGGAFLGGVAEWKAGLWFPVGTLFGDVEALTVHGGRLYAGGLIGPSPDRPLGVVRWVE